jgi:hypothetical protein
MLAHDERTDVFAVVGPIVLGCTRQQYPADLMPSCSNSRAYSVPVVGHCLLHTGQRAVPVFVKAFFWRYCWQQQSRIRVLSGGLALLPLASHPTYGMAA